MDAKERQHSGLEYSFDEQLAQMHLQARQNVLEFNQISPFDEDKRKQMQQKMLGKAGKNLRIYSPFMFDFGTNISFGDDCFVNCNCVFLDCGKITIGNNVFIGPQCGLYTPLHPMDVQTRNAGVQTAEPITICDNVWLGGNVTILPGVTIGEGAVIGAGSVVTKDIPPRVFACGNPCVVKKVIEQK